MNRALQFEVGGGEPSTMYCTVDCSSIDRMPMVNIIRFGNSYETKTQKWSSFHPPMPYSSSFPAFSLLTSTGTIQYVFNNNNGMKAHTGTVQ
jgi:hypothetical protein